MQSGETTKVSGLSVFQCSPNKGRYGFSDHSKWQLRLYIGVSSAMKRYLKIFWIAGLCFYGFVLICIVDKGTVNHSGFSPFLLLFLYIPLTILGGVGLKKSTKDRTLLKPSALLMTTGIMGSFFAPLLHKTHIFMYYSDWVQPQPTIDNGTKLFWLSGYTLLFILILFIVTKRIDSAQHAA